MTRLWIYIRRIAGATGLLLLMLLSLALPTAYPTPVQAASVAQNPADLCSLLPPGALNPDVTPGLPGEPFNLVATCGANYASPDWFVLINLYPDPAQTQAAFNDLKDRNNSLTPLGQMGEEDFVLNLPSPSSPDYALYLLAFRRGCYIFEGKNGDFTQGFAPLPPELPGAIQAVAAQVDQNLKGQPPCPGANLPPQPPGGLGVSLVCNTLRLASDKAVTCAANPANARPDAQLVFNWSYDGQTQTDVTGDTLDLSGVTGGTHRVSVVARDTQNNLTSPPAQTTFGGFSLGPLVGGGGVIGIGGAIIILILLGRARRRPARQAASVPATGPRNAPVRPPQAPASGVKPSAPPIYTPDGPVLPQAIPPGIQTAKSAARPPTLPEPLVNASPSPVMPTILPEPVMDPPGQDLQPLATPAPVKPAKKASKPKQDRSKDQAWIKVNLIVSPSVRTRDQHPEGGLIWGDGVDFVFAGYSLQVAPGWSIVGTETFQFEAPGNNITPVGNVVGFNTLTLPDNYAFATPERKVIVQSAWTNQTAVASLNITVKVHASLIKDTQDQTAEGEDSDSTTPPLTIIGANPQLDLWVDFDTCFANGSFLTTVYPILSVFDTGYTGGSAIELESVTRPATIPETGDTLKLDKYFAYKVMNAQDAHPERLPQSLQLRCKFHLEDEAIQTPWKYGYPISLNVRVTGFGPGLDGLEPAFNWIVADHYKACKQHFGVLQPTTDYPRIKLIPSKVIPTRPDPSRLPHGEADNRFVSQLTAIVRANLGDGDPVPGSDVTRDRASAPMDETFAFRFYYDPPTEEWRKRIDPGLDQDHRRLIQASGVDEQGHLMFGSLPYLDYDHQKYFEKPIKDHPEKKYLFAQTCDVQVELLWQRGERLDIPAGPAFAVKEEISYPTGVISIDAVSTQKYYQVMVRVKAQSNELIAGADVSLGLQASPGQYTQKTDQSGMAVFSNVEVEDGDLFTAAAFKYTQLTFGFTGHKAEKQKTGIQLTQDKQVIDLQLPCSSQWSLSTQWGMSWAKPSKGTTLSTGIFGGGFAPASLTNRVTKESCEIVFIGGGLAPGVKFSAWVQKLQSAGFIRLSNVAEQFGRIQDVIPAWYPSKGSSLYTPKTELSEFDTELNGKPNPVMFEDFNGNGFLGSLEVSLFFVGFAPAFAIFTWVYDWPVWVGSVMAGSLNVSGQLFTGVWSGASTPGIPPPQK
jgi:hypothetical protein